MAVIQGFSQDISGYRTREHADRLVAALQPEADARGLLLQVFEITAFDDRRCGIAVACAKHRRAMAVGNACPVCLREERR